MYDEERSFSWTNLFIKIIIIIICILFIVWLFSLTNKKVSNKLDIITDNIFSENVDRLKTAGKDYFTTDRLPKEVGEVKKVTLEKLYKDKVLLTLKNKNGENCLAKKSYVSVEKMENEYKMRVYLDCGEEKDYIIFPMEWYNNCTINTNTCDNNKSNNNTNNTTNNTTNNATNNTTNNATNNTTNNATNNNTSNTNNNNTNNNNSNNTNGNTNKPSNSIPTTVEAPYVTTINDYRCDKNTGNWVFIKYCQSSSVVSAKCSVYGGGTVLLSNLTNGAHCSSAKPGSSSNNNNNNSDNSSSSSNTNVIKYEYVKVTNGYWTDWSDYSKWSTTKVTATDYRQVNTKTVSETYTYYEPVSKNDYVGIATCPKPKTGYAKISAKNGVCEYAKKIEIVDEVTPKCDKIDNKVFLYKSGSTCHYRSKDKVTSTVKYHKSDNYVLVVDLDLPSEDKNYTYEVVKRVWRTDNNGSRKLYYIYKKYTKIYEKEYEYSTENATCPEGSERGKKYYCETRTVKYTNNYEAEKICSDSSQKVINGYCYLGKTVNEKKTGIKNVTYYQYRTRKYIDGNTSYKWSTSKNDSELIKKGYKLTGKTC